MEPTAISLPWVEIAKLALGAGVVATIVTQFAEWLKDRWTANQLAERDATYLAARIAVTLEKFAIECADRIADGELHRTSRGDAGHLHTKLPALGDYPSDADWKVLEPALLTRAHSFRNELAMADRRVKFYWDLDPEPNPVSASIACDAEAGKCGYRAWQIAADMRSRYKLPSFEPEKIAWDLVKTLKERHDQELELIQKPT